MQTFVLLPQNYVICMCVRMVKLSVMFIIVFRSTGVKSKCSQDFQHTSTVADYQPWLMTVVLRFTLNGRTANQDAYIYEEVWRRGGDQQVQETIFVNRS